MHEMMKPAEREAWLLAAMARPENRAGIDTCDADLVREYSADTGAAARERLWGAPACPMFSADLSRMERKGLVRRHRTGLQGMAGMGFPRWVWSYRIP